MVNNNYDIQEGLPRRPFKIVGGFMEQAQKILELYQQIEKHIRFLEGNIISEDEENDS